MAKRTIELYVDDLDGSEADETVSFEIDGKAYEIDLSDDNVAQFRAALAPYLDAGTKTSHWKTKPRKLPRTVNGNVDQAAKPEPVKPVPVNGYTRTELPPVPDTKDVRRWAKERGLPVPERGRLKPEIYQAYNDAHAILGNANGSVPERSNGNRLGDQVKVVDTMATLRQRGRRKASASV